MLLLAFDTGMRKEEVLALQWEQVDLEASTIALAPEDTKTDEPRLIVLTSRAKEALRTLPSRFTKKGFVLVNRRTKTRWVDIKKRFGRAVDAAEFPGLWFHDLRRSFITRARRVGVPESVVIRMSGHRARAVFETARWCARSRVLETRVETPKPRRVFLGRAGQARRGRYPAASPVVPTLGLTAYLNISWNRILTTAIGYSTTIIFNTSLRRPTP